jgi:hypothetical protein
MEMKLLMLKNKKRNDSLKQFSLNKVQTACETYGKRVQEEISVELR